MFMLVLILRLFWCYGGRCFVCSFFFMLCGRYLMFLGIFRLCGICCDG